MPSKLEVYKCDNCSSFIDPTTKKHILLDALKAYYIGPAYSGWDKDIKLRKQAEFTDRIFCDTGCLKNYLDIQLGLKQVDRE